MSIQRTNHDPELQAAHSPWMSAWCQRPNPPTVPTPRGPGFADPDVLIEIEIQAVLK